MSKKILIVDDEPLIRFLLEQTLEGLKDKGVELLTADDGHQAWERAQQDTPDLVFLDVMMPQVDGWKVLGRLCHHPLTERVPILVCTILAQEELAFSLGASGVVRKPVTRHEFLTALDQVVREEQEPG